MVNRSGRSGRRQAAAYAANVIGAAAAADVSSSGDHRRACPGQLGLIRRENELARRSAPPVQIETAIATDQPPRAARDWIFSLPRRTTEKQIDDRLFLFRFSCRPHQPSLCRSRFHSFLFNFRPSPHHHDNLTIHPPTRRPFPSAAGLVRRDVPFENRSLFIIDIICE